MRNFIYGLLIFSLSLMSCEKLVQVESPIDVITSSGAYASDITAASVLSGLYFQVSARSGAFTGPVSASYLAALSADELVASSFSEDLQRKFYQYRITNEPVPIWQELYSNIFKVNGILEGIAASKAISDGARPQLLGEARFLRGLFYFYLVNLFGDIPLLTNTDMKANAVAPRKDKGEVYAQIVADLKQAMDMLGNEYKSYDGVAVTSSRARPNKSAAAALLARVYLYTGQWDLAISTTTALIGNPEYVLEPLERTFLADSKEAFWQVPQVEDADQLVVDAKLYVLEARNFRPSGIDLNRPVYLTPDLYNAFEIGDQRKTTWVDTAMTGATIYPYAYKYKQWSLPTTGPLEGLVVLRLAEQYLIRAEALAMKNDLDGARSDLDIVRARAGLGGTTAVSQEEVLAAILRERRVELFTEFGHRWLDIKRSGKTDAIMAPVAAAKGVTWKPYMSLYPIPVTDIQRNPSLKGHQNPGYPEL